ncbi:uncharacterized protein DUF3887 [Streptomyces puniciscabiei]|uniref:Uncharacterized protein DUF3887 n=1 Tax=Streptomyces puniciscabiei TaxID=164348 RepID=A0A542UJC8_9ACTN|nr:DUF3887 domain-containing protein [Streptomyces puniciscabiei]TQK99167.1 uncharacterized protein DUF3887 [Streptomyces puniciscabiei]
MSDHDMSHGGARRLVRAAAAVALAATALLSATGSAPAASKDDTVALHTLDDIVKGHYKAATAHFDASMRKHLPPDGLEKVWKSYQAQFGHYRSHGKPKDTESGRYTVVGVPLRMQHSAGEFRLSFDKKGSVAGLFFLKPGVPVPKPSRT